MPTRLGRGSTPSWRGPRRSPPSTSRPPNRWPDMHMKPTRERTIRLLMDWPIEGMRMKGWIVQKDIRAAALLVKAGYAEYVPDGTAPHPEQLDWARDIRYGR